MQTVYFWQEFTFYNKEYMFKSGKSDVWLKIIANFLIYFYIDQGE